jgi:hypothetical protein
MIEYTTYHEQLKQQRVLLKCGGGNRWRKVPEDFYYPCDDRGKVYLS